MFHLNKEAWSTILEVDQEFSEPRVDLDDQRGEHDADRYKNLVHEDTRLNNTRTRKHVTKVWRPRSRMDLKGQRLPYVHKIGTKLDSIANPSELRNEEHKINQELWRLWWLPTNGERRGGFLEVCKRMVWEKMRKGTRFVAKNPIKPTARLPYERS